MPRILHAIACIFIRSRPVARLCHHFPSTRANLATFLAKQQSNFEAKCLSNTQLGEEMHTVCIGGWVWNCKFHFSILQGPAPRCRGSSHQCACLGGMMAMQRVIAHPPQQQTLVRAQMGPCRTLEDQGALPHSRGLRESTPSESVRGVQRQLLPLPSCHLSHCGTDPRTASAAVGCVWDSSTSLWHVLMIAQILPPPLHVEGRGRGATSNVVSHITVL